MDLSILKKKLKEKGDRTADVADMLDISRTCFSRKLNGIARFKSSEIHFLEHRYCMTPKEVFFAFVDETKYETELPISSRVGISKQKEIADLNIKIRCRNNYHKKKVYSSYLESLDLLGESPKKRSNYYKTKLIAENKETGEVLKFPTFGSAEAKFMIPVSAIKWRVKTGNEIGGAYGKRWFIRYATDEDRSD